MTSRSRLLLRTVILLVVFVCAAGVRPFAGRPTRPSILLPQPGRDKLTASDLLAGRFPYVVPNEYFLPVGETEAVAHEFSGVILFPETPMTTTRPDRDWSGAGQSYFPAVSLRVVRRGDTLLPLDREIIYSGGKEKSYWNVIASPGRVWQEPGDGGWARASFPFVLTDSFLGQALNGLATFLFTSTGISWVAVQITQETSPKMDYTRGDFHAALPVQFVPQVFDDEDLVIAAYEAELAARPPVKDWSELPMGGFTRSFFNSDLPPQSVSLAALLIGGILYIQPAETRSGLSPYPLEMRHGVFSETKTLVMGLSMFYCAERYGENLFNELITDYVPELAGHPGWRGVTFVNALDMATGTQGNDRDTNFILARSTADKLAVVRSMPDTPSAPGTSFDYSSSNTFTLSCALNRYVKAKEDPGADYWFQVCDNVLQPLGIAPLPVTRTIEPDGALGTPVAGWGCYPTVIEVAKVGLLLSNEGVHEGRQILNRNKVREALERTTRRGFPTYSASTRYLHSLWIGDFALTTGSTTAPYMSGHGGNIAFVLPGGLVAVRFADEDVFDIAPMVAVAEFYRRLLNPPGGEDSLRQRPAAGSKLPNRRNQNSIFPQIRS